MDRARQVLEDLPSLSEFLETEPALTTGFEDAVTGIPYLDDFEPSLFTPFTFYEPDEEGRVHLPPGTYRLVSQSYCLKPGGYRPDGPSGYADFDRRAGEGYLDAPFLGEHAEIIQNVLRRSVRVPEVPQRDVQLLLWAILARTDPREMSPAMVRTARTLLTDEEMSVLAGFALDEVPEEVFRRARSELPAPLLTAFEAEARLRGLFERAGSTYDEFESVAVRAGVPPTDPDAAHVPRGRWSYVPEGYLVRYAPHDYVRTTVDFVVPDRMRIERDDIGRIVRVVDPADGAIEIRYSESRGEPSVAGDPGVRAYAIESVRASRREQGEERTISDAGAWVLVGTPTGSLDTSTPVRYPGLPQRYEETTRLDAEWAALSTRVRGSERRADRRDLVDLAHLREALHAAGADRDFFWVLGRPADEFLANAWQAALCVSLGGCAGSEASSASSLLPGTEAPIVPVSHEPPTHTRIDEEEDAEIGPTVAVPANPGRQRIGVSQRCRPGGDVDSCRSGAWKAARRVLEVCLDPWKTGETQESRMARGETRTVTGCYFASAEALRYQYCGCRCSPIDSCSGPPEPVDEATEKLLEAIGNMPGPEWLDEEDRPRP